MDLVITLTDAQAAEVARMNPRQKVPVIVQTHVDTWIAPFLEQTLQRETQHVREAFPKAPAKTRATVLKVLGLPPEDEVVDARRA